MGDIHVGLFEVVMFIWCDHVLIRKYNYPRIDSLGFIDLPTRVKLHRDEDKVLRRFRNLATQEESHTLDRSFMEIHQRLNNRERNNLTTAGYGK
jgi:hypothetical protein